MIGLLLLVVGVGSGAGDTARADGYMTARGLYDDCSEGTQARLDPERAPLLRKCENFLRALAQEYEQKLPKVALVDRLFLCIPDKSKSSSFREGRAIYKGQPEPFLAYWDVRGLGPIEGYTMSARTAVDEFLRHGVGVCTWADRIIFPDGLYLVDAHEESQARQREIDEYGRRLTDAEWQVSSCQWRRGSSEIPATLCSKNDSPLDFSTCKDKSSGLPKGCLVPRYTAEEVAVIKCELARLTGKPADQQCGD